MLSSTVIPLGDNTLSFSWTPTSGTFTWVAGGTSHATSAPQAIVGTPTTFVAVPVAPRGSGRTFTLIAWDFGDGSVGYGLSVAHTFLFANPHTRVTCTATDNRGVTTTVGRQVYPA